MGHSVQQTLAQTLPFFFAKTVDVPAHAVQPTATTETLLSAPANGSVAGSTMNHDYRTEYAENVTVGLQLQLTPTTAVDVSYLRHQCEAPETVSVSAVPTHTRPRTSRHWVLTTNYDGKDCTVTGNSPYGDAVAVTRVDASTTRTINKTGGKITVTQTAVVSKDGKMRTVTTKGKDTQGQPVDNVTVYDKQ